MRQRFTFQIGALKMLLLQINAMCTLLLIVANPGSTFFAGKIESIISSENLLPSWTNWSYNNWGTKWLNWLQAWNLSMINWIKTWNIELKWGLVYKKMWLDKNIDPIQDVVPESVRTRGAEALPCLPSTVSQKWLTKELTETFRKNICILAPPSSASTILDRNC